MSAKTSKTINYTDADFVIELEMRNVVLNSELLPHNWEQMLQRINTPAVDAPTRVPAEALAMMPTPPQLKNAKQYY